MPISHKQIASQLIEIAGYRELEGSNQFSIAAYRKAAGILNLNESKAIDGTNWQGFEGIGPKLAGKIDEAFRTGKIQELEEYRAKYPNLVDLTTIPGIGNKRALALFQRYGVRNREELQKAFDEGRVTDPKLREGLEFSRRENRMDRLVIENQVRPVFNALKVVCERVQYAGSMRRKLPTVKDVDILVTTKNVGEAMRVFQSFGPTVSAGGQKCSIFMMSPLKVRVDLLVIPPDMWGSALLYFTGSKQNNIKIRGIAKSKGMLLNEHGLFKGEELIASKTEKDIYDALNLMYQEPEDRN